MVGMDAIVAGDTAAHEAARPSLGVRAMVVEDEPDLADVISDYLQRRGFDVEISRDGAAAVAAARVQAPMLSCSTWGCHRWTESRCADDSAPFPMRM